MKRVGPHEVHLAIQRLHAAYLSFDHPIEERRVVFESGLPRDLDAALSELGEPARGDIVADLGLDQE